MNWKRTVDVLVWIVILLFFGLVIFKSCSIPDGGQRYRVETIQKMEVIITGLEKYFSQSNQYPASLSIVCPPKLDSTADPLQDSWGQQFEYELKQNGFLLLSAGPDGQPGTSDDIVYDQDEEAHNKEMHHTN